MGDRGNIYIVQHPGDAGAGGIYLYTHWGGSQIARTVQCALLRGGDRSRDEPYLARIIFSEMTYGRELETTGFGMSSYLTDNEYDIVVVDSSSLRVGLAHESETPVTYRSWSFDEFAHLDLPGNGLVADQGACAADQVRGSSAPTATSGLPKRGEDPPDDPRAFWGLVLVVAVVGVLIAFGRRRLRN